MGHTGEDASLNGGAKLLTSRFCESMTTREDARAANFNLNESYASKMERQTNSTLRRQAADEFKVAQAHFRFARDAQHQLLRGIEGDQKVIRFRV
jgi:hypothetical protein